MYDKPESYALIIIAILLVAVAALSGKSLSDINNSSSTNDPSIQSASKLIKWSTGLSVIGAVGLIILLVWCWMKHNKY